MLSFGLEIEKDNLKLYNKLEWVKERRSKNLPCIPTTLAEEEETNVFMRCTEESVQKYFQDQDPVRVLRSLRTMKDEWKYQNDK